MLGLILATGSAWTWWPMFVAAILFYIAGTEVRLRAEEKLLSEHFKDYGEYRSRTWGYIPFIR